MALPTLKESPLNYVYIAVALATTSRAILIFSRWKKNYDHRFKSWNQELISLKINVTNPSLKLSRLNSSGKDTSGTSNSYSWKRLRDCLW